MAIVGTLAKSPTASSGMEADLQTMDLRPAGNILLVGNNHGMGPLFRRVFRAAGFNVLLSGDADHARGQIARYQVDLVLIDVLLPDESHLRLFRELRAVGNAPVLLLSEASMLLDRLGAADGHARGHRPGQSETQPLSIEARGALLRCAEPLQSCGPAREVIVRFDGWRFHPQRRYMVSPADLHVRLTASEADLLLTFCQHPLEMLTREQLLACTRGRQIATPSRAIDILVSRLRRKMASGGIPSDAIQTIRSDGYLWRHQITVSEHEPIAMPRRFVHNR